MLVASAAGLFKSDPGPAVTSTPPVTKIETPGTLSRTVPAPVDLNENVQTVAPATVYVNADTLNVRSSPSTDGIVLAKLGRGTAVVPQLRSGNWYGIAMADGSTGWLHGDYLANVIPSEPVGLLASTPAKATSTTNAGYDRDAVVEAIINASLRSYSGSCPCPYNTMRSGRRCGGNSAYSKPGGRSPICYPSDVTERMIADYVSRH